MVRTNCNYINSVAIKIPKTYGMYETSCRMTWQDVFRITEGDTAYEWNDKRTGLWTAFRVLYEKSVLWYRVWAFLWKTSCGTAETVSGWKRRKCTEKTKPLCDHGPQCGCTFRRGDQRAFTGDLQRAFFLCVFSGRRE